MRNRLLPVFLVLQQNIFLQHGRAFHFSSTISSARVRSWTHQSNCPVLLECTQPRAFRDFRTKTVHLYGQGTRRYSHGVSSGDHDAIPTEKESQRIRAQEAFSVLARTKKSWQRLGHLVEMAVDNTINDTKGTHDGGRSIADVGTDHGLLAMSFALSGRYERVLGVDLSEQALQNGALSLLDSVTRACKNQQDDKSNAGSNYGRTIPLSLRVSDGLEKIEEGEADTVCIAGMGVHTMIKILSMPSDNVGTTHLDRIKCQQLLLQPTNSRPSHMILLYDHLQQSGWRLVEERIEELSKRWYITSCFQRAEKDGENIGPETPATIDLPGSKLVGMQNDSPMYPAFQNYVAHHFQWIKSDTKVRGELKEEDGRWMKAFQQVVPTQ